MSKILISTIGTSGDVNPYISIAKELKNRGHSVAIATSRYFEKTILNEGIGFHVLRPEIDYGNTELAKLTMHPINGTEYVIKEILMRYINEMYSDLLEAAKEFDFLVNHSLCFAGPVVAEQLKMPWLSSVLSPNNFWSIHDPFVLPNAPFLKNIFTWGPSFNKVVPFLGKIATSSWCEPLFELKRKLGQSTHENPLFEGMHSQYGVIALFSRYFAKPRPDWPENTIITGFPLFNENPRSENKEFETFLKRGKQPVIFTLGTAAVLDAKTFFSDAITACRDLNLRAVLLNGNNGPKHIDKDIFQIDYLPFQYAFENSLAIVHHGGIGTTARVLYSGKPNIVVPYSHDQPDNANRLLNHGVAKVIYRNKLNSEILKKALKKITTDEKYMNAAQTIKNKIQEENGVSSAADVIEIKLEELL